MKNIQVIDGAMNCTYEVYTISDKLFTIIFPHNADIAFLDEAEQRLKEMGFDDSIWNTIYRRRLSKRRLAGIHGTLHLTGSPASKRFFPTRREKDAIHEYYRKKAHDR